MSTETTAPEPDTTTYLWQDGDIYEVPNHLYIRRNNGDWLSDGAEYAYLDSDIDRLAEKFPEGVKRYRGVDITALRTVRRIRERLVGSNHRLVRMSGSAGDRLAHKAEGVRLALSYVDEEWRVFDTGVVMDELEFLL